MRDDLPKYDAPPVVETVLGVQFARLPLSAAHVGWFWKNYLTGEWTTVRTVQRLEDIFERPERSWGRPSIRLSTAQESRLQFIRADNERMVQVQDSRFIYNWRRGEGAYPSYEKLLSEFQQHFSQFQTFVEDAGLGSLDLNQWEVVYVNQLPRGDLWHDPSDWPDIFPGFSVPTKRLAFDTFSGVWSHLLDDHRGRLHIECRHSKTTEEVEVIRLQLTARGPLDGHHTAEQGFELGHQAIVLSFTDMTSAAAHKHWKRTR